MTKEPSVSASATLPNTIQVRPSHLAGLLAAVAILTSVTTWSVSQITTESHGSSNPASEAVSSPDPAAKARVDDVVALDAEQRIALFGNLTPAQQYAPSVDALSPSQQAAIWGNVSPTIQYVDGVTALTPDERAAIYGNVVSIQRYPDAVAALPREQLVAMFGTFN
jgi:hypothetical protein